jgi:hypothetical protein
MVDNIQNYWIFGLCSLSTLLKTGEHNVSESGFVGVTPSLEEGNRSNFRNAAFPSFLEYQTMNKPKT